MDKINFMMSHRMLGAEKKFLTCTCGHKLHYERTLEYSECPECKAQKIEHLENLIFGKQDFSYLGIVKKQTPDKIYDFNIEFHLINANYKINFSKKEFAIKTSEEHQWLITFNKNMPEFYKCYEITNIETEEKKEIELDSLLKEIEKKMISKRNNYWQYYGDSLNADAFYKGYDYNYTDKIRSIIKAVKGCKTFCAKYEQLVKSEIDIYDSQYLVDLSKTSPVEQLKVSPAIFKRLIKSSSSYYSNIIQISNRFKEQALNYLDIFDNDKEFSYTSYNYDRIYRLMAVGKISLKKIHKYIYEDAPRKQGLYTPSKTLELLYDSFEMIQSLKLDFEKSPSALVRYHDVLTREYDMVKDEIKNENFISVVSSYKEYEYYSEINEEEILNKEETEEVINKYLAENKKDQKYNMVLPKDIDDLVREGSEMNHCVGGYVDRVIRRESLILFLRKADNPNKSYATIEVKPTTKRIYQIRCNSNSRLKDKSAIKFIEKWCKEHDIKVNNNCY